MALGWSQTIATQILRGATGGTAFAVAAHHVQFHGGDPGAAGTANVVNGGKRTLVTFGTAVDAQVVNNAEETWTDWEGGTPTHWSSWSAATGGTFQCSGLATLDAPVLGATLTVSVGGIVLAQAVAT